MYNMKQIIHRLFIISVVIHFGGLGIIHAQESSFFSEENSLGQLLFYKIIDSSSHSVEVWGDVFQYNGSNIQYQGHLLIPDTITHNGLKYAISAIKNNAFKQHREIKSVSLPNTITRIGDSAFYWCMGISELNIPTNVGFIGHNAFFPIPNIVFPSINAENTYGALAMNAYEEDSLFYYDSTKSFLAGARKDIHNVSLPGLIDTIGPYAFIQCFSLDSIQMPEGLKVIQHDAFNFCSSMRNLLIPSTVISIEESAFKYCGTPTITINNAPVEIHEHAFDGCEMVSIDFGNNARAIKGNAFTYCTHLQSVYIPESVEIIGDSTFLGCINLLDIYLPQSLTNMPHSMCRGCIRLRDITIPSTLTNISEYALFECRALQNLVLLNPIPPTTSSNSFYQCNANAIVTVPCGSAELYSSNQNWSYFNNIEEDCDAINEAISDRIKISSRGNHISIHGATDEAVYIFDAVGRQIYYTAHAVDNETIPLQSTGVYIVKVGNNKAKKVITIK